jgi:hypothetical protein
MSALFEMPAADLTLTSEELAKITGHARAQGQLQKQPNLGRHAAIPQKPTHTHKGSTYD